MFISYLKLQTQHFMIGQLLKHSLKGRSVTVRIESYSLFIASSAALKGEQALTSEGETIIKIPSTDLLISYCKIKSNIFVFEAAEVLSFLLFVLGPDRLVQKLMN